MKIQETKVALIFYFLGWYWWLPVPMADNKPLFLKKPSIM
jgi:hypothetical protein